MEASELTGLCMRMLKLAKSTGRTLQAYLNIFSPDQFKQMWRQRSFLEGGEGKKSTLYAYENLVTLVQVSPDESLW